MNNRTAPKGKSVPRFYIADVLGSIWHKYIIDRHDRLEERPMCHEDDAEFVCAALNAAHEREKGSGV